MAYYKGKFFYTNDLKYKYFEEYIAKTKYRYSFDDANDIEFYANGFKIKKMLKSDIYEAAIIKDYKFRKELIECLNDVFSYNIKNLYSDIMSANEFDIIYEIVKDNNGNLFAKELYTGLLFPILSRNNYFIDYQIKKVTDDSYKFYLKGFSSVNFDSLYKCNIFIAGNKIADQNEVEKYQNRFNKGFRKVKKKQDYIEYIKYLYNKNVFKENFNYNDYKEKKEVVKINQSIETSLMEDIDYSLMNLKDINEELYIDYKKRFDILLTKNITKENLALLLGEIEFSLIFGKRNVDDILEFLTNLKKEYLDNFLNGKDKKTELDIRKLDKINELFLCIKDKYSLKNQRDVLRNIAFLYLMEVYENKDLLTEEELSNSYFSTHLKTIIIWIKLLIDDNIIESNYLISLNEELNVKMIFDLIKNIKFKKINDNKVKVLIKSL